jgi:hypothetical protein
MDYTLQNAYNELASANTLYSNYKARWQFLLESYQGGEEYRTGKHLTMYKTETGTEYAQRLATTPLDNHCRSVISVYTSFLFREEPEREFNSLDGNLNLLPFLDDADLDGRSLDAFMKDVAIWSAVFGHCWIIVAKPQTNAQTRAGELEQGVRPYVNVLTPLVVTDWTWERQPSGAYELSYIKYLEEVNDTFSTVKEWTRETITTSQLNNQKQELVAQQTEVNQLGKIPAVIVYAARSPVRGIGASLISDISDFQKTIYNLNSEVEQSIRLNGHPTLVKTADVEASAGAGSIALMPDNLDPGLRPYLLNVATDVNQIYTAINNSVIAIDKMANTGSVRANETQVMSGVAMEVEFQLLGAKLAEFADALELAEEQMWRIWALYEGGVWDGEIEYPGAFNIRDTANEYKNLQIAKQTATTPDAIAVIDYNLRHLLDDPRYTITEEEANEQSEYEEEIRELNQIAAEIRGQQASAEPQTAQPVDDAEHPTTTPETRSAHIQEMIMEGYTDEQILAIHPEITAADITAAKEQLLNLG